MKAKHSRSCGIPVKLNLEIFDSDMLNIKNYKSDKHLSNRFPRTIGAIMSAIGLGLAKWQIYDPLHAAERHQQQVWISGKLIGIAIIVSIYGLALVVFGRKTNDFMKIDPKNIDWGKAFLLFGTAIICLAAYVLIMARLSAQGYK
jgi:xanthine/uracil permease